MLFEGCVFFSKFDTSIRVWYQSFICVRYHLITLLIEEANQSGDSSRSFHRGLFMLAINYCVFRPSCGPFFWMSELFVALCAWCKAICLSLISVKLILIFPCVYRNVVQECCDHNYLHPLCHRSFFFFFHKSERINQSIVGFKVLTCNKPFKFHPRGWMLLTSINSGDGDCENQAVMLQLRVRYSSTSQNICWPGCLFHSSLDFIGWFSYLHN